MAVGQEFGEARAHASVGEVEGLGRGLGGKGGQNSILARPAPFLPVIATCDGSTPRRECGESGVGGVYCRLNAMYCVESRG